MFLNKFRVLAAIAPVSTMLLSAPAQASTLELNPSSKWVLDYAEDSCALRRMFGEGKKSALLEIRRFSPVATLQVTVSSNASGSTKRPFKFRFLPNQQWQDNDGTFYVVLKGGFQGAMFSADLLKTESGEKGAGPDTQRILNIQNYRKKELDAAAKLTGLEVQRMFGPTIMLKTGALRAPMAAMHNCLDELLTHWGIDPKAQQVLQRPAIPTNFENIGRKFRFPAGMAITGMPGLVNIRVDVSATGDVTGCHIQLPLSDPAYEKSACKSLQRELKFEPALDKDGKPIASYWTTRVIYKLRP